MSFKATFYQQPKATCVDGNSSCRAAHIPRVPSRASSWLFGCRVASSGDRPGPPTETGSDFGSLRVRDAHLDSFEWV